MKDSTAAAYVCGCVKRNIWSVPSSTTSAALLDLFEPEAVFIDPDSGAELRGHGEIRQAVVTMFEYSPRIDGGGPPKVWISGDVALVLSRWSMEATAPDGQPFRQSGTATDVMRRQSDGTWRYVIDNPAGIDHMSSDIDAEPAGRLT